MNTRTDLPLPLTATLEVLPTKAGAIALYEGHPTADDAHGANAARGPRHGMQLPPMLLVHSVNASASAAEMAPLFDYYRQSRSVYALDLPGFGFSDRSDRTYTPRLMTDAVLACLQTIATRNSESSVDLVALSLSGEFAVRAQTEQGQLVRTLTLISPTGFNGKPRRYGPPGESLGVPWLHALLTKRLWAGALFKGLTRPGVIRYFLQRSWGSKQIDETLWQYDMLTARQTGAQHAPLYFLSAYLFSRDINDLYERVLCPVWVSMATRGDFTDYQGRHTVEGRPNWQFHPIAGGALPYFEDLGAFTALLDPFLLAPSP